MRIHLLLAVGILGVILGGMQKTIADPDRVPAKVSTQDEITRLVRELGDSRWKVRVAATERLREIGRPAVPALREAFMSPDMEVKVRARMLLNEICLIAPDKLAKYRKGVQEAFQKADYATAARLAHEITQHENAHMLDWLWLGHACQLGGKWSGAVEGYSKVVSFIDSDIRTGLKNLHPKGGPEALRPRPGPIMNRDGPVAPAGPIPLNVPERKKLINQRTLLTLWIARMQRAELKAPAAAAKTLKEALDYLEASKTEIDHVWLTVAREYPLMLHESGDLPGAVSAWKRSVATRKRSKRDYIGSQLVDVERIHSAIVASPDGSKRPEVPWIYFLSTDNPVVKLDLGDPNTQARSYHPGMYSRYAFAPPPGKEFDTIEFSCDIEQFNPRFGGQFGCFVKASDPPGHAKKLGSINWPRENGRRGQPGRKVISKTIAIPPGAGLAHIRVGSSKGNFIVHGVVAKATFRPITKNAPAICADAWMQTELYPPEGQLTWGQMKMRDRRAYSGIRTGRNTLRFSPPGRETLQMPLEIKPGRRYGLFINFDSPFKWRQLDLELSTERGAIEPSLSIQRIGNGEYLAVWWGLGNKILAARSKDLVRWSKPSPLPFNSVFDNIVPGTFLAADGTLWLAFFSNRLCLQTSSSAGYNLWITHTRDGKNWADPRRIEVQRIDGWPLTSPSMLSSPDGKQWIFCRNFVGSAETLGQVGELSEMKRPALNGKELHMWNFRVFHDGKERFHMVCDNFGDGIYHLTSTNGTSWQEPHLLVAKTGEKRTRNPQLIRTEGKYLLVYDTGSNWYLTDVDLQGDPIPAGTGEKISSHLVPLTNATPLIKDGKIFYIAGTDTSWLLEASLKDLTKTSER